MARTAVIQNPTADVDDAIRHTWGLNISEQMALLGLTNKALVGRLSEHGVDVSVQAVGQWRSGKVMPTPRNMIALAAALRVPPRVLFSLDMILAAA